MAVSFPHLLAPGRIGPVELKNRMVMAPHSPNCAGPDGSVTDLLIDYFEARARGGAGLVIVEDSQVVPSAKWGAGIAHQPEIRDIATVDAWKRMTDAIHYWGAKAAIQLNWVGVRIHREVWPGVQPTAPSAVAVPGSNPTVIARAVTLDEIVWLEDQFAMGAAVARRAGFDAVMLHASQGYGISAFSSEYFNKRNDLYGGSFENRMRFAMNIVRKVRAALSPNMALIVRIPVDEFLPPGNDREGCIRIARMYEAAGVDGIHLSCGLGTVTREHTIQPVYFRRAYIEPYLAEMRKAVKAPLGVAGSFNNPEDAERVLKQYKVDFIDLARPLIADPDYPAKIAAGRPEDVRICVRCNECIRAITVAHTGVECTVNPEAGREARMNLAPAARPKKVVVIGGGVGGMEAARVAALRGHTVTLYEKNDKLGGNLIPASAPDFKLEYRWLIDWYTRQLEGLGVKVNLGSPLSAARVSRLKPDAVIVATGAVPILPEDIAGLDKGVTAIDAMLGRKTIGKRVIIAGGGLVGCDTALFLAQQGKQVTIIEMLADIGADMPPVNKSALLVRFKAYDVRWVTGARIAAVTASGVATINLKTGQTASYPADSVVLALGLKPVTGLADALRGKAPEVYAIGDCVKARKVKEAIYEGSVAGRRV